MLMVDGHSHCLDRSPVDLAMSPWCMYAGDGHRRGPLCVQQALLDWYVHTYTIAVWEVGQLMQKISSDTQVPELHRALPPLPLHHRRLLLPQQLPLRLIDQQNLLWPGGICEVHLCSFHEINISFERQFLAKCCWLGIARNPIQRENSSKVYFYRTLESDQKMVR